MFKITSSNGTVYYADEYLFNGNNIVLNRNTIISGDPSSFTIKDLSMPGVDSTDWLIDLGPFFDRFGSAKMSVLISPHPVVQGILKDVMSRKWVDLKRPDVAYAFDAIIDTGTTLVTTDLKHAILTTPVAPSENAVLKKLYFS